MGNEFLLHGVVSGHRHPVARLPMWRNDADRINSMKREINPQESNRAEAFRMWMSSPMPMVTFLRPVGSKRPEVERVKTLDVSRLVKVSKKS